MNEAGVNHLRYLQYGIARNTRQPAMLPNEFLIRGKINTVNLVATDKALDPLNFYTQLSKNIGGTAGNGL